MCQCEWTIPCVKGALTKAMATKMDHLFSRVREEVENETKKPFTDNKKTSKKKNLNII